MTSYQPSLEDIELHLQELLGEGSNVVPIFLDLDSSLFAKFDPPEAYLKIRHNGSPSMLLETAEVIIGVHTKGKADNIHSIIATDPFHTIKVVDNNNNNYNSTNHQLNTTIVSGDPLKPLEQQLEHFRVGPRYRLKPDLLNGASFGYFGYDCIRYFEPRIDRNCYPLKKDSLQLPDAILLSFHSFILFDHKRKTIRIVALVPFENLGVSSNNSNHSGIKENLRRNYNLATQRIQQLKDTLLNGPIHNYTIPTPNNTTDTPQSNLGEAGYKHCVTFLKERIVDGDIIQAVPSHRVSRPTKVHPFHIYCKLRTLNPSRYMFYIDFASSSSNGNSNSHYDNFQLVGASPELLVQVHEGVVINHPIAGTRMRSDNDQEDNRLADELISDEKERAEHIMLVDLGRNDVNRVCEPLSVKVDSLMHIERYSHVMHIVSEVSGKLRSKMTGFDAFRSIFPAGTVSGAPKIKAMELIAQLEANKRHVYAGAVGYFGFTGNVDTCIAIRTIVYKDGVAHLQAGGGIVYDSNEQAEYQETVNKMAALARAVDQAESEGSFPLLSSVSSSDDTSPSNSDYHQLFVSLLPKAFSSATSTAESSNSTATTASSSIPSLDPSPTHNRLLMIDNYDSFTWNLYQYLCQLGQEVIVYRNDCITLEQIKQLQPDRIVISPGPSWPKDAGISNDVIREFAGKLPVLGVCLGHECMVEVFGGKIEHCGEIVHGKTSKIRHDGLGVYRNVQQDIPVTRYHSLAAPIEKLPPVLIPTSFTRTAAKNQREVVMGVRHQEYAMEGVQFHPESIMTEEGMKMLGNFVTLRGGTWKENGL